LYVYIANYPERSEHLADNILDRSNFHPVGTASMLPRSRGGVVSPELRVYGTRNVRVVDASVLPFQVCGHLTSTLYAVAEKAADMIKKQYRL
jgi:choline dehydrogenase-like flavoprotein